MQAPCVTHGTALPPIWYPQGLKAYNIAFSLDDFDKLQNVASTELLLSILSTKKMDKSLEDIHSVIQQLQVPLPTIISIGEVTDIDAWAISNASYSV